MLQGEDKRASKHLFYVDIGRIFAVIAVVVLHVSAIAVGSYGAVPKSYWWIANIANSACRWAVPCFVMLSGALLLAPEENEPAGVFLKRRAKRIAIPMMIWFLIYFLWLHFWKGQPITLKYLVKRLILGGPYYHLYFLYLIATLYAVSPLLNSLLRRLNSSMAVKVTAVFLLLGVADSVIFYSFFNRPGWLDSISTFPVLFSFTFGFIGYFLTGYQLRSVALSNRLLWTAGFAFALSLLVTCTGTYLLIDHFGLTSFGPYFYDNFSPTSILMSVSAFCLLKGTFVLRDESGPVSTFIKRHCAPATFGVYLVHPIFLEFFWKAGGPLRIGGKGVIEFHSWIGMFLLSGMVLVASFGATMIVQKIPYLKRMVGVI
jgi:surface polysaccharide O-acyltransferase-like enzyme